MHDLGFYQVYELNVDFTEKVREEISPLFDNEKYVKDGDRTRHSETDNKNVWGNGHVPFEDCGPWTQKFVDLFDGNFLQSLRLSKFSPTNSYDWHIGIEQKIDYWKQTQEEPEIHPYQVKQCTLNILCSPSIGDRTLFATEVPMRNYRGYFIGYGEHDDKMWVVDDYVVDRNPVLLNTAMFHKIEATGTRNIASFLFAPYVSFATAVAYCQQKGILIPRTDTVEPYWA